MTLYTLPRNSFRFLISHSLERLRRERSEQEIDFCRLSHFVFLPQMRLVAFHLEQKQKSFSRFLNIFVGTKCRILVPKKISSAASCRRLSAVL